MKFRVTLQIKKLIYITLFFSVLYYMNIDTEKK